MRRHDLTAVVQRYLHAEKSFSLDSIVWGGEFATLTDVVYYDNVPYLLRLRTHWKANRPPYQEHMSTTICAINSHLTRRRGSK